MHDAANGTGCARLQQTAVQRRLVRHITAHQLHIHALLAHQPLQLPLQTLALERYSARARQEHEPLSSGLHKHFGRQQPQRSKTSGDDVRAVAAAHKQRVRERVSVSSTRRRRSSLHGRIVRVQHAVPLHPALARSIGYLWLPVRVCQLGLNRSRSRCRCRCHACDPRRHLAHVDHGHLHPRILALGRSHHAQQRRAPHSALRFSFSFSVHSIRLVPDSACAQAVCFACILVLSYYDGAILQTAAVADTTRLQRLQRLRYGAVRQQHDSG